MDAYLQIIVSLVVMLHSTGSGESCTDSLEPKDLRAYYGWPLWLKCNEVAQYCELDGGDYQCNITGQDNNESFYSIDFNYSANERYPSYEIKNVTAELSSKIEISIQNEEKCCFQTLRLQKLALPKISCEVFDIPDSFPLETTTNSTRVLECAMPDSSIEAKLENIQNYPITWYYNCGTDLPVGVANPVSHLIVIGRFNPFIHTGSYSCSIEYNGETRFITEYSICAKPLRPKSKISIFCKTDKIRYNIGDTASIECDVNVGSSVTDGNFFTMNFYPLLKNMNKDFTRDKVSCTAELENERSFSQYPYQARTSLDDRVSCSFKHFHTFEETCMSQIPSHDEWEREVNKTTQVLKMKYTMNNLQKDDFGFYQAFVRYNTMNNNATDIVTFSMDMGEQERAALVGGALCGAVAALIFVGVLLYYFWLNLKVFWRRSRCVPYDADTLEYGAYFTYSWSNEVSDYAANETYDDLIFGMRNFIKQLGFNIYDPAEKPAECQWNIQNTKEVQQKCDRVIIILTGKLLEQPTAEQELYENFMDKQFILIKTPSFESEFDGLSEDRKNGLKAHFQRNYTIKWSGTGGKLSKKFKMELELSMPKKRKDRLDDAFSYTLESRI